LNNTYPEQPIDQVETTEKKSKWRSFFLEIFQTLFLALIFYFIIDSFFPRVRVENISMKPTLQPGELLLVNKLAYTIGNPRHGDVIVFHYPGNPEEDYIKRLIGLPGDEIRIEGGLVYINGQSLEDRTFQHHHPIEEIGKFLWIRFLCWEIIAINHLTPIVGASYQKKMWLERH
jgi:signal peptidase I